MKNIFIYLLTSMLFVSANSSAMDEAANKTVSTTKTELPAAMKTIVAAGAKVIDSFDVEMGLTGYLTEAQGQHTVIYVSKDGNYAFLGAMLDAQGRNLTAKIVAEKAPKKDLSEVWKRLEKTAYIEEGKGENVLYVFYEPNCSYCGKYYDSSRQFLSNVRFRWVPVAFLSEKSPNIISAIMNAKSPALALQQHEMSKKSRQQPIMSRTDERVINLVHENGKIMKLAGVSGTPATIFLDAMGTVQVAKGVMNNKSLSAISQIKVSKMPNGTKVSLADK